MTKRYQIDREQAVRRFHKQAEESGQELQLHLPLKEVAAALQQGVGELMRQAGLELMQLIMDNEVRQLADGAGVQPEVEVAEGQPGRHRKRFPVEVELQNRRLAARRPAAATMRLLTPSAFVV